MSTTPPANTPDTQPWTTKSKKLMGFGSIILLATIGFEPDLPQVIQVGQEAKPGNDPSLRSARHPSDQPGAHW